MRKTPMILLAVSTTLLCGGMAWAAGGMTLQESQAEYSADSYIESEQVTLKAKVYYAPGKERREQEMEGSKQISIMRMDKALMWTLMPDQKMYMEMNMKEGQRQGPGVDMSGYEIEKTEVGKEVIDGYKTTKYKVIMTDSKGNKFGGFMWFTKEGIQIKMDAVTKAEGSKARIKMELKNLKIEKQDPALFEIPAGYTKMMTPGFPQMDMGKGGMKGMPVGMPKGFGQESE